MTVGSGKKAGRWGQRPLRGGIGVRANEVRPYRKHEGMEKVRFFAALRMTAGRGTKKP